MIFPSLFAASLKFVNCGSSASLGHLLHGYEAGYRSRSSLDPGLGIQEKYYVSTEKIAKKPTTLILTCQ
jgi:hypothetical protein